MRPRFTGLLLLLILAAAYASFAHEKPRAQRPPVTRGTVTTTITEPGSVKLDDLFKQADIVAVFKVLSGDAEHYKHAVYKTEVVTPFKGVAAGETVYLGTFIGYRVGWEYVAFLKRSTEVMSPQGESGAAFGTLPSYFTIMYDGYSMLQSGYNCVFDGKEISEQCDYGIKINTNQVILPKTMKAFPPPASDAEYSGTNWVRKKPFLSYLETLKKSK